MTHYAVSFDHLAWIEAESADDALEQAANEFESMLVSNDIDVDFSVVDSDEFDEE